jgi:hypothetical protein
VRWLGLLIVAGCGFVATTPTGRTYERAEHCPSSYAAAARWGSEMTTSYRPTADRCSYPQGECVIDHGSGHPHDSYQCMTGVGAYFQDARCPDVPYTAGARRDCTPDEVCRYYDGHVVTWRCRAGTLAQDDVREDGCPVFAPDDGSACAAAAVDRCVWPGNQGQCVGGRWRVTRYLPL